jgi:hypothetical protein
MRYLDRMSLSVCSECGRHKRDVLCPFCKAVGKPATPASRTRLRRAAMFAAATLAVTTDCGGTTVPLDGGTDANEMTDAPSDVNNVPFYGGCPACFVDAGADSD